MSLEVRMMGGVAVALNGTELKLGGPKRQELLAMLALAGGQPLTTDRLIDLLWESPPPSARRTVQSHVAALRSILGDDGPLRATTTGYVLDLGADDIDLFVFERMVSHALALGPEDRGAAAVELDAAVSTWREPLAGLTLSTAASALIAPYEALHLQAIDGLVAAQIDTGNADIAIRRLERLVREHPTRENLWFQLARGLGVSGRRDAALQTVQRAREVLREQLGVDPSTPLRTIEIELLEGVVAPVVRGIPERHVEAITASNLPVRPTSLIGREHDVANVRRLIGLHRLVTITAVGGAGKTRLAIAAGEEELDLRSDGVWFVDLAAMAGKDVAVAVADAIGLRLGVGDPTDAVIAHLSDKAALVILDNCEHVVDACARFASAMLHTPGRSVMLATSREALHIDGEQVVHLESLSSTSTTSARSDAAQLFVERAISVRPDFAVTTADAVTIDDICRRLDGLPLAIELAAARVTVLTPDELLAGLDDRFTMLSKRRGPTIESTLDWSYDLLDDHQQRAFRAIGVFVGGFDIEAAAAVIDDPPTSALDVIELLVAKSLVIHTTTQHGSRFRLLETMKAYAEARLVEANELDAVAERHAHHFHWVADARGRTLLADARIGRRLRFDTSNISAALSWLADREQWVTAGELLCGSLGAYENYGRAIEARTMFDRCEEPLAAVDAELADHLRSAMMLCLVVLDDYPRVTATAQVLSGSDDARCRVIGSAMLAFVTRLAAPAEAARRRAEAARHLAQAQRDRPGLGTDLAHGMLLYLNGIALGLAGDYHAALAEYDAIPDTDRHHGFLAGSLNTTLPQAAVCHILLGDVDKAIGRLTPLAEVGYAYGALHEIDAIIHFALGDVDVARKYVRTHALEAATGRLHRQCNDAVMLLSELALAEGDRELAVDLLDRMGIARSPGTIMYSRELAARLERGDERAAAEGVAADPSTWPTNGVMGSLTAMSALHAELIRRGWTD